MDEVTASQVSGASLQNELIANQHRLAPLLQPRETSELRVRPRLLVIGCTLRTCLSKPSQSSFVARASTESSVRVSIGHCRQERSIRGQIDFRLEYSVVYCAPEAIGSTVADLFSSTGQHNGAAP